MLIQTGDKRPITSALANLQGQFFTNNNLIAAGCADRRAADPDRLRRAAEAVHRRPDAGRHQGLTAADGGGLLHLRAAGCSLLLDARGPGPVTVPHWGPDLGADLSQATLAELAASTVPAVPRGTQDVPVPVGLLPAYGTGDPGRPGLLGSRAAGTSPRCSATRWWSAVGPGGPCSPPPTRSPGWRCGPRSSWPRPACCGCGTC